MRAFCYGLVVWAGVIAVEGAPEGAVCPLAAPYDLRVEGMDNPEGVDVPAPRLSWKLRPARDEARDLAPAAYQILVASSMAALARDEGDLWDSGRVESSDTIWIPYGGRPLRTGQRCYWKVRAWERSAPAAPSPWSEPARWIVGVMRPEDWSAKWIGPNRATCPPSDLGGAKWIGAAVEDGTDAGRPGTRWFRRSVELPATVTSGVTWLEITADDSYQVYLNGRLASRTWGHLNRPRWVRRIDVSEFMRPGTNVIAVQVPNATTGPCGLLLALHPAGGETVATDGRWWVAEGGRLEERVGDAPAPPAAPWRPVLVLAEPDGGPWGQLDRRDERLAPAFETTIRVRRPVREATMFISGLGFYETRLNGTRVGDRVLDPPPTRYDRRVLYSTYDLTGLLAPGEVRWRIDLGHGWYDVRTVAVWNFDNAPWRDAPRVIAQLDVLYDDGTRDRFGTGDSWHHVEPVVAYDCIREGELVGVRRSDAPDLAARRLPAEVVPAPAGRLGAAMLPPSRVTRELPPMSLRAVAPGVWVADFGQNLAGWIRLRIREQPSGTVVTVRYGERLAADGRLDPKPIDTFFKHSGSFRWLPGGGFQTDRIVARGLATEVFEPRFVYHGFQYVELSGLSNPPRAEDVRACVVHTDFRDAGGFQCDVELLNRIFECVRWSYRGNFVNGYPTDCPHREKNGWTGDAHLAAEFAMYAFDNAPAYAKWVRDLLDEQQPDGSLPGIVPTSGWGYQWGNGPAWDSALLIVPWLLYIYRGDRATLAGAYEGMRRYVEYLEGRATNHIVSFGLGDWIPVRTKTPVEVTSTAYFHVDARIVARAAQMLGRAEEAQRFEELADRIARAFHESFHRGEGRYSNAGQTAQACALHQGLVPADLRSVAGARLVEAIEAAGRAPDFGVLGSKYVFRALSEIGRTDLAFALATREVPPSFGAWIRRGATTFWEDWGEGASRNHVMFGDVAAWMMQYLAGLRLHPAVSAVGLTCDTTRLAFREFVIAPEPVRGLGRVRAWHDSPQGRIEVEWRVVADRFEMETVVPVGTRAWVVLPVRADAAAIQAEGRPLRWADGRAGFVVGSGRYRWACGMSGGGTATPGGGGSAARAASSASAR
ncbi:MAG: glycoside hydrolase family 78 protein [Kiritimatiellae bacterium]|nr:glycoside hydrolase family 78 protein [Kiritimatiellia bacterium]